MTPISIGKILNKPLRVAAKIANVEFVYHVSTNDGVDIFKINKSIAFTPSGNRGGTIWVSDGELTDQDIELIEEYLSGNVTKDYLKDVGIDSLNASDVEFLIAASVSRVRGK